MADYNSDDDSGDQPARNGKARPAPAAAKATSKRNRSATHASSDEQASIPDAAPAAAAAAAAAVAVAAAASKSRPVTIDSTNPDNKWVILKMPCVTEDDVKRRAALAADPNTKLMPNLVKKLLPLKDFLVAHKTGSPEMVYYATNLKPFKPNDKPGNPAIYTALTPSSIALNTALAEACKKLKDMQVMPLELIPGLRMSSELFSHMTAEKPARQPPAAAAAAAAGGSPSAAAAVPKSRSKAKPAAAARATTDIGYDPSKAESDFCRRLSERTAPAEASEVQLSGEVMRVASLVLSEGGDWAEALLPHLPGMTKELLERFDRTIKVPDGKQVGIAGLHDVDTKFFESAGVSAKQRIRAELVYLVAKAFATAKDVAMAVALDVATSSNVVSVMTEEKLTEEFNAQIAELKAQNAELQAKLAAATTASAKPAKGKPAAAAAAAASDDEADEKPAEPVRKAVPAGGRARGSSSSSAKAPPKPAPMDLGADGDDEGL